MLIEPTLKNDRDLNLASSALSNFEICKITLDLLMSIIIRDTCSPYKLRFLSF